MWKYFNNEICIYTLFKYYLFLDHFSHRHPIIFNLYSYDFSNVFKYYTHARRVFNENWPDIDIVGQPEWSQLRVIVRPRTAPSSSSTWLDTPTLYLTSTNYTSSQPHHPTTNSASSRQAEWSDHGVRLGLLPRRKKGSPLTEISFVFFCSENGKCLVDSGWYIM